MISEEHFALKKAEVKVNLFFSRIFFCAIPIRYKWKILLFFSFRFEHFQIKIKKLNKPQYM
jgi:hypothetical protein